MFVRVYLIHVKNRMDELSSTAQRVSHVEHGKKKCFHQDVFFIRFSILPLASRIQIQATSDAVSLGRFVTYPSGISISCIELRPLSMTAQSPACENHGRDAVQ